MRVPQVLLAVMIAAPYGQRRSLERDLRAVEAKQAQQMEDVEDPHRAKLEEARRKIRERHRANQKKSLPEHSL